MKLRAALVALPLLLGACGGGDGSGGSTPEGALTDFLAALEAGDCAAVKEIVVTPSTVDCELVETLDGSFAAEGIDLGDIGLEAGEVTGDSAVVTIDWGTDQDDETWNVERIGDEWRVLFDSEA